jgi:hypothetical protein
MTVYNKLYVVVRTAQAIQASHAAVEWARDYGHNYTHPTFVFLSVENKLQLQLLRIRLILANKSYVLFHEPDHDRGLTAIAIHHYGANGDYTRHSILKNFKLWKLK